MSGAFTAGLSTEEVLENMLDYVRRNPELNVRGIQQSLQLIISKGDSDEYCLIGSMGFHKGTSYHTSDINYADKSSMDIAFMEVAAKTDKNIAHIVRVVKEGGTFSDMLKRSEELRGKDEGEK